MDNLREATYKVIKTIASPLHFFAVVTIVLGTIIIVLAGKSILPADVTANIIIVAFVVLLILIVIVGVLVIFYPKKLTFDQEAHLTLLREKLGDNELSERYESGIFTNVAATRSITQEEKTK